MNPSDTVAVPPIFDESTLIAFVVAVFLPMAIAYVRSHYATSRFASLFAFGVCAVTALLVTFLEKSFFGKWSSDAGENVRLVILNFVAVLQAALMSYQHLWKPIGVIDRLERSGGSLGAPKVGA